MKSKKIKIIMILVILMLVLISFEYDKDFDLYNYLLNNDISKGWKDIKINYKYKDLTKEIKWENVKLDKKQEEYLFPSRELNIKDDYDMGYTLDTSIGDDTWKLKKYENKMEVFNDKKNYEYYILVNNKKLVLGSTNSFITGVLGYQIYYSKGKGYIIYYPTKDKNTILYPTVTQLNYLNLKSKDTKSLFGFYGYLLNILGEYLFTIEVVPEQIDYSEVPPSPPGLCYYILHRVNLKTREDHAINMLDYGIYTSYVGDPEYGCRVPLFDISLDKRFIYFWGGHEKTIEGTKKVLRRSFPEYNSDKTYYGVFVYDLWEDKLYRIMDITSEWGLTITNNIEDNFLYIRNCLSSSSNSKEKTYNRKYEYYKMQNFETYMKNKK
jgi:hypothetical protein